jgi:hypothetical protein
MSTTDLRGAMRVRSGADGCCRPCACHYTVRRPSWFATFLFLPPMRTAHFATGFYALFTFLGCASGSGVTSRRGGNPCTFLDPDLSSNLEPNLIHCVCFASLLVSLSTCLLLPVSVFGPHPNFRPYCCPNTCSTPSLGRQSGRTHLNRYDRQQVSGICVYLEGS